MKMHRNPSRSERRMANRGALLWLDDAQSSNLSEVVFPCPEGEGGLPGRAS